MRLTKFNAYARDDDSGSKHCAQCQRSGSAAMLVATTYSSSVLIGRPPLVAR